MTFSMAGPQQAGPQEPAAAQKRDDHLLFLVNRITQGFSSEAYAEAQALGFQGFLEQQLDHENIDDAALDAVLANFTTLGMTAPELFAQYGQMQQGVPAGQLRAAAILRSVFSRRQLFERMVEFWTDHFNIYIAEGPSRHLKLVDDREVVRAHALGSFPDLLIASSKSAAMLQYLDNQTNIYNPPQFTVPQENYSRELMELHTLGVDAPYVENDVREVARALTGWRYRPPSSPNYGDFWFLDQAHDDGEKQVIDLTLPAGLGQQDGETIIQYFAQHPNTARFISRKMCSWLLAYDPPQVIVDAVTATYESTNGEIKAMIRTMLNHSYIALVDPVQNPKLRRPFHFVVSILRAVQPQINSLNQLLQALDVMGNSPFYWPAPNGYPDSVGAWGSAVLPRWEFASRLLANGVGGINVNNAALYQRLGRPAPGATAQAINDLLMGGAMSQTDVDEVQAYVDGQGLSPDSLREAVALACSAPSFQYY